MNSLINKKKDFKKSVLETVTEDLTLQNYYSVADCRTRIDYKNDLGWWKNGALSSDRLNLRKYGVLQEVAIRLRLMFASVKPFATLISQLADIINLCMIIVNDRV